MSGLTYVLLSLMILSGYENLEYEAMMVIESGYFSS